MLDPKFIRDNLEKVKQNTLERNIDPKVVDEWVEADVRRSTKNQQIEQLNQRRNEIAEILKDPLKRTPELIEEGKEIKKELDPLNEELKVIEDEWLSYLQQIPNIHFDDVPKGKDDSENVEIKTWGEIPNFDFHPKDHVQLGVELGILDFETGAKIAGSQFYYVKNDGVLLELALQKFGFDIFQQRGFELVITPDMAKSRYYLGTGYTPRGDEAQTYEIKDEDLGLIATSEVTMAGYFADQVLDREKLPLKYAALSHCFRKEAGAYGKYSKGLYRVHQFTKMEMFVYCTPQQSEQMHEELLEIEEEIVQKLKLPYRVLKMCTGDLGGMAAKKYDIEAWMPGRNDYGEVTSTSNCTDYQARNLNIRYKDETGEHKHLHMLNGTAIVMSRFPIAILENYQQADGTIKVPDVLVPYMGKEYLEKRNQTSAH